MKTCLNVLAAIVVICMACLLLLQAGKALFTGESFPPPRMENKAVYYIRAPAPSPLTP